MNRKDRRAAGAQGAATTGQAIGEAGYVLALAQDHHRNGRMDEAAALFARAIALDPNAADAHLGLARILMERDEPDDAMIRLRRALALRPGHVAAGMTMVMLLKQQGKTAQAAAAYASALAADPRIEDLRRQLLDELATPWARPIELARAAIAFVRLNPTIAAATDRAVAAWPARLPPSLLFGPDGIGAIAGDRVLCFVLNACPVCDIALERFLTNLRAAMLALADQPNPLDDDALALACALAGQCFLNEYAFSPDEDEAAGAARLRDRLAAAIADGSEFPMLWLPVVAAYGPLHTLPGADRLLDLSWPDLIAGLLRRQIAEPLEEQACRATLPALTPIEDAVSLLVRQQYEENPYPRWIKPAPPGPTTTMDAFIRSRFPQARYRDLGRGHDISILIAGCGTGQHSIETAQRFARARIRAIDLSRASLAYAQRQSRACGLERIEYAQADIMNMTADGPGYDLIESSGVLHHLADPLEGWRRLLALLRPGGVMRIGLYSELARRDIVAVRQYVAAQGYGNGADDIRRCRQDLMARADGTPLKAVTAWPDFFSTSECRDLLFHVMEHRLTLPAIKAFLTDNRLEFLGFDLDPMMLRRYRHRCPGDIAMTDLDSWHRFEQRHPASFAAMYQFWVQTAP